VWSKPAVIMASFSIGSQHEAAGPGPVIPATDSGPFPESEVETELPFPIEFYTSVSSTMDVAKERIAISSSCSSSSSTSASTSTSASSEECFVIVAEEQKNGRGTRGRTWTSSEGNLFMTFAVRTDMIQIPVQLTPLRIGTLVRSVIQKYVSDPDKIKMKWPNDVLIGYQKLSGILIEINDNYVLIGIGINVGSAPQIALTGQDCGRSATCLIEHLNLEYKNNKKIQDLVHEIGQKLSITIYNWARTSASDSAERITSDFGIAMDTTIQRTRPESQTVESVCPIKINLDGTLLVKTTTGSMKTLMTDYLM
jgi:biotin-[acetyl-CoA-carboxylase] ligase BirA-like protein